MIRDRYTPLDFVAFAPPPMRRFASAPAELGRLLDDDLLIRPVKADPARPWADDGYMCSRTIGTEVLSNRVSAVLLTATAIR